MKTGKEIICSSHSLLFTSNTLLLSSITSFCTLPCIFFQFLLWYRREFTFLECFSINLSVLFIHGLQSSLLDWFLPHHLHLSHRVLFKETSGCGKTFQGVRQPTGRPAESLVSRVPRQDPVVWDIVRVCAKLFLLVFTWAGRRADGAGCLPAGQLCIVRRGAARRCRPAAACWRDEDHVPRAACLCHQVRQQHDLRQLHHVLTDSQLQFTVQYHFCQVVFLQTSSASTKAFLFFFF